MTAQTNTRSFAFEPGARPEIRRRLAEMWDQFAAAPAEVGFDVLRIYLGIGLFVRGALFAADPGRVIAYMDPTGGWLMPMTIAHYVALAHLGGGLLLALGVYTRLAAGVQVPALIGAVFFVHLQQGLFTSGTGQELEFSALVLVMLLAYTVFGSGPVSVDRWIRRAKRKEKEPVVPSRDAVDVAGDESFPASDPPGYGGGHV